MKDGIYIRPAIVRFVVLVMAVVLVRAAKAQVPVARRYWKFETM